jgi:4-amino-4-deoxy-L-arabinose transferase-like glycosyltransferase
MSRLTIVLCIVLFAIVMIPLKLWGLPWILDSYGWIGIAVFIGLCLAYALWVDHGNKKISG